MLCSKAIVSIRCARSGKTYRVVQINNRNRSQGAPARETAPERLLQLYSSTLRRRSELAITDTELKLIAAAARMGLSNNPKKG